jgi:tripartite-type tricarboxylate transporter receptor subunit TctC
VLAIHPSVPAKSVKELIALAKAQPGRLTFASTGVGGTNHLAAELFKSIARVDILHVPYKGTATAFPDLLGGQVAMMFTSTLASLPQVRAGRLRALGISSAKRSLAAPDLPTLAEAGVPGYESGTWFALLAPAGTPLDIITRLNATVAKVSQMPEVRDQLIAQGSEPLSGTPGEVHTFVRNEIVKLGKIIAAAGVRAE